MKCAMILLLVTLLFPLSVKAESQCPWINKATVADSQDTSVKLETQATGDEGSCLFRYQEGKDVYQLHITVRNVTNSASLLMLYESQCASGVTRLSGVGNEAVLCRAKPRLLYAVQVVGRVRNQVFVVYVSEEPAKDESEMRMSLQEKATIAAKQVAGNLF